MISLNFLEEPFKIGATPLVIQDGDTKILAELGLNYAEMKKYYGGFIQPRDINDRLAMGLMPYYKGLYYNDKEECDIDAITITHSHVDHCGNIPFAKIDIPICCSKITNAVIRAREDLLRFREDTKFTYDRNNLKHEDGYWSSVHKTEDGVWHYFENKKGE